MTRRNLGILIGVVLLLLFVGMGLVMKAVPFWSLLGVASASVVVAVLWNSGPSAPAVARMPDTVLTGTSPAAGHSGVRPTDGFAVASLVLGILGLSLLGIVFGFVSLSRTKNGLRDGRGLAKAGIAISLLWVVASIAVLVYLMTAGRSTGY